VKRTIYILVLLLAVLGASVLSWFYHPWVPANRVVYWESTVLGDFEFRVCQRKTRYLLEPFETYLLVKKDNSGSWQAYSLDINDTYGAGIALKQRGSDVVIFHHGKERASFNQETGKMKDSATGLERNPVGLPGGV